MRLPNLFLTLLIFTLTAASSVWSVAVQAADPEPTVKLRVTVDNKIINHEKGTVPIKIGKPLQLKIEKIRPDGVEVDVTNNDLTIYYPIPNFAPHAPYALSITKAGLVTVTIVREDYATAKGNANDNLMQVYVLHSSRPSIGEEQNQSGFYDYGLINILFEIEK